MKGICASACYYAVSPADAIYADSNALIGSIGVRMDHWNLSEIMSTVGVKNEPLTAGEFKDALDPFHPLSDSTREFMQKEILNTMHEKFITDVELGRGKSFSRVMMPMLFLSIQAVYGQHLRQLSTARWMEILRQ